MGAVLEQTGAADHVALAIATKGSTARPSRSRANSGSAAADNLDRLVERFRQGEFDLVGVGRSLLNDPDWLGTEIQAEVFLPFDSSNLEMLT